jgi:hypothetical protein
VVIHRQYQKENGVDTAGKHGVLRAYVWVFSVEVALIALLWAVHVSRGVLVALFVVASIVVLFGKQITGPPEHIRIVSLAFEHKIQDRYRSESNGLSSLGFNPLFFFGEAFPLSRLLLIYPAFLFLIMLLNREVVSVENRSKLCFGFPVFISSNKTTYAHPLQLGIKYHTLFQDGTILLTKNFGANKKYGPTVVLHIMKNASISDTWAEHQKQIQALEATGKQTDRGISFQTYSNISREA